MEDGLYLGWKQEQPRSGTFCGYTVHGFKYTGPNGEAGWHIKSWPMRDPIHDFWVANGEFFTVKLTVGLNGVIKVEVGGTRAVEQNEKAAALAAIKSWEEPTAVSDPGDGDPDAAGSHL